MKDVALTLDNRESIQIYFYEGRTIGAVYVWQENEDKVSVSIIIKDQEKFVIEITDKGEIIEVIKK